MKYVIWFKLFENTSLAQLIKRIYCIICALGGMGELISGGGDI